MLQVLVCILIADFITGLIHWAEDTYGVPEWPVLGRSVIEPNILHHENQLHFTMSGFFYRNYQVLGATFAIMLVVASCNALSWQITLIASLTAMGNETHAWAHKRPRSRVLRLLQDMKIIITPEQHARHHRKPYDTNFCTITNWLNPLLDLGFWRMLESLFSQLGISPQRCSVARKGY
jgi:plasmanylethanolamine desaturase